MTNTEPYRKKLINSDMKGPGLIKERKRKKRKEVIENSKEKIKTLKADPTKRYYTPLLNQRRTKGVKEEKIKAKKKLKKINANTRKDYSLLNEYGLDAPRSKSFMSDDRPVSKRKKSPGALGGKIKNRNMGGVIGGGLASKDVNDYLYKYNS